MAQDIEDLLKGHLFILTVCLRRNYPATHRRVVRSAMKLRKLRDTDFELLLRLFTDSTVRKYLGGALTITEATTRVEKLLQKKPGGYWVIESETVPAGTIIFGKHIDSGETEISYQLLPEWTGRGLALKSVRALLEATEHSIVVAETQVKNTRSRGLLERLRFRETARLERYGEAQVYYELRS